MKFKMNRSVNQAVMTVGRKTKKFYLNVFKYQSFGLGYSVQS
jgi:hypothetical protein